MVFVILRSAHELSHIRSEKKYQEKKYSWQREIKDDAFLKEESGQKW